MNNQPNILPPPSVLWKEEIPGGAHWSFVIKRGMTLRLTDMQGGANVSALFYNAQEKLERYNMADTLKAQHTAHLTKGFVCYSDMGRVLCSITQDSCGWHDTVCGMSDAVLVKQKYGEARYQEHRNAMHRNARDGFLIELGKWGLGHCGPSALAARLVAGALCGDPPWRRVWWWGSWPAWRSAPLPV